MTDGIEGCTQVKEDEDGEDSRISCHKKVVGDFDECCFSAMKWAEPDWNCSYRLLWDR